MPFRRIANAFAFSSLLAASVGLGLTLLSGLVFDAPNPLHWALLVAAGTFVVYNLDRLRDTARDATTSPERTAFIERHRPALTNAVAIAAVAFGGLLSTAPVALVVTCLSVGLVGLFHRRIKHAGALKTLYVSLAWLIACVGLPWIAAGRPQSGLWVAAIVAPVLCTNLIASNLGKEETPGRLPQAERPPERAQRLAGGLLLIAMIPIAIAPRDLTPLAWLAIAEGGALWRFRKSEHYRMLIVDGALLVGSLVATLHFLWLWLD